MRSCRPRCCDSMKCEYVSSQKKDCIRYIIEERISDSFLFLRTDEYDCWVTIVRRAKRA